MGPDNIEKLLRRIGPVRFILLFLLPAFALYEITVDGVLLDDIAMAMFAALYLNDLVLWQRQSLKLEAARAVGAPILAPVALGRPDIGRAKHVRFLGKADAGGVFVDSVSLHNGKDPGWNTPQMWKRRRLNIQFAWGLASLFLIAVTIEFLTVDDRVALSVYSVGLIGWGVLLGRDTMMRARGGEGLRLKLVYYPLAAVSAIMGLYFAF